MMRIGSGTFSGRKLQAPPGGTTRPTSARLKKSLFDVLASSSALADARVLDLYAGAGALGLESLSRGAATAVFVERGRKACDVIRRNIEVLDVVDRGELLPMDVRAAIAKLEQAGERFDLVFADPPYKDEDVLSRLLSALGAGQLVVSEGLVVVEHHHKQELSENYGELTRFRLLKSGESCFTLYRRVC